MRTTMKREFLEIAGMHGLAAAAVFAFLALIAVAEAVARTA